MLMALSVGLFSTVLLIFGRELLMRIFVSEIETIKVGMQYLLILGYSQLFMCVEITITGAFNGMGRTYLPNFTSILLTGARIPLAIILCRPLGLDGVWWSISITSIIKGIVLASTYLYLKHKDKLIRLDNKLII